MTGGASPAPIRWPLLLPFLPALGFLVVFLVLPLVTALYLSLSPNVLVHFEGLTTKNYQYLFSKAYYVDVISRTLRLSFVTTVVALLIGYPTALALKALSERVGATVIIGLTFPILAGPLVVVLGWMILLIDGGPVIRTLTTLGLGGPFRLIGTETAVAIGLVHFTLPFVVLTIFSSLKQIPDDLLEAARSLGANRLRTFSAIVWPLSLPGVLSAVLIAFSLAASAYVSPHYLGGATRLTLTTLVAQFILATFNSEMAAAAAVVLLVIMLTVIFVFTRLVSRYIRG